MKGNENMNRFEAAHRKPFRVHPALNRPWSFDDLDGLSALAAFSERLRFTQKLNYAEQMTVFIDRGICTHGNDFETLMERLDNIQSKRG